MMLVLASCWLFQLPACSESDFADDFATTRQALEPICRIEVGGGGNTEIIELFPNQPSVLVVNTSANWDFIRKTSGPCHFTVYNEVDMGGRYVTLGSDLEVKIRAGEDGVRYKDSGGGDTWKIRSVRVVRFFNNLDCHVSIGGGGVRMTYYPGSYARIPAVDRMNYFVGGNCTARLWNERAYGALDSDNRFAAIQTNTTDVAIGKTRPVFDPGFRIRSMIITHWGNQYCTPNSPNYDFGRCLPIHTLPISIYTSDPLLDRDGDGLNDELENELADAFRPIAVNHSTENATRVNVYTTVDGNSVSEPVVAFQVRQAGEVEGAIEIVFMKLWLEDKDGGGNHCDPHAGDTQWNKIHLKTPMGTSETGKVWWLYSTHDDLSSALGRSRIDNAALLDDMIIDDEVLVSESIEAQELRERQKLLDLGIVYDFFDNSDLTAYYASSQIELSAREKDADKISTPSRGATYEFEWKQGDINLDKPQFERLDTESNSIMPRHLMIYFVKGKHHEYQDARLSGQHDPHCFVYNQLAHIDSRGELRVPPLPQRPFELRSPAGKGDRYNYNNVGSRDKFLNYFMNSLDYFGFPGKRIWEDACFYSTGAHAPNRAFYCSTNVDKRCCLDDVPICKISNSWHCH